MVFLLLVIIIIIINFFRQVFSECTEAIVTSLKPLVTNFREICASIIVFSFTVWTKMRPMLANWASEASPTLGCSIEISRDIYMCMCLSYVKLTA